MKNADIQNRKSGGVGKFFAVGCLTIVVVLAIVGFLAVRYIKSAIVDQYTDTQPRPIPYVTISADEANALTARVNAFKKAVKEGTPTAPLALSGDEINKFFQCDPKLNELKGKVYVTIEGDKIKGDVGLPLDKINKMLKGRYLNGSAVFSMQLSAGRLFVFMESMEVKGKTLPEDFMKGIRAENLAKDVNTDAEMAEVLGKLEVVKIENGRLLIVPKARR